LVIGFGIKLFLYKVVKKKQRIARGKQSEVILIIECEEKDVRMVQEILWDQNALGIANVK
jgi:hypothetical protein